MTSPIALLGDPSTPRFAEPRRRSCRLMVASIHWWRPTIRWIMQSDLPFSIIIIPICFSISYSQFCQISLLFSSISEQETRIRLLTISVLCLESTGDHYIGESVQEKDDGKMIFNSSYICLPWGLLILVRIQPPTSVSSHNQVLLFLILAIFMQLVWWCVS